MEKLRSDDFYYIRTKNYKNGFIVKRLANKWITNHAMPFCMAEVFAYNTGGNNEWRPADPDESNLIAIDMYDLDVVKVVRLKKYISNPVLPEGWEFA